MSGLYNNLITGLSFGVSRPEVGFSLEAGNVTTTTLRVSRVVNFADRGAAGRTLLVYW